MRLRMIIGLLLVMAVSAGTTSASIAAPGKQDLSGDFKEHEGAALFIAHSLLHDTVRMYYKVYGVWPASWSAVKSSGLFQNNLYTHEGVLIDPDDRKWDTVGDLQYIPGTSLKNPQISRLEDARGMRIIMDAVEVVPTYRKAFESYEQKHNAQQVDFAALLADQNRMTLFGIKKLCASGIRWYTITNGGPPSTWEEFLTSPYSPIGPDAVNPVTGGAIFADGRANDLIVRFGVDGAISVHLTDENGKIAWPVVP